MSSPNYVDFSQAYKKLKSSGKNADRIVANALNEAGDYAGRYLKVKTPMWKGKEYKNKASYNKTKHRQYDKWHSKHHIAVSKATGTKHAVEVGYDDDVSWKIHFAELGTIKQKPQYFIKQTMEDVEGKVASIIQKALQEAFLK